MMHKPIRYGDSLLADGGILDSVPADICRSAMGKDNLVLTCSLETPLGCHYDHVNKWNTLFRSIYIPLLQSRQDVIEEFSDVVFQPMQDIPFSFSHWKQILNFNSVASLEQSFVRGREEALRKMPLIRRILKR